jgi:alanyl-tRNA synthetase
MTGNEIRKRFLEFFAARQHAVIESDSVVPKDDPTVLFTTAGMQQFKRQFLGHIDGYTRACSSQKCIRTDDLDEVGRTDFHHTFFEMLGNFSFGDYFKEEAIAWAWEFLTGELGIPAGRLWVSVYKDDDEAARIWREKTGVPAERIFRLGDKSNFWPSNAKQDGPNGPCGPCSEIFYDYDPETGSAPADPDDEPGRFCEVWNLVFTQYNRKDGGELLPLPGRNIDTGMGLERLTAVMQGARSNFETDLFAPILKSIDERIKINSTDNGGRNERYVIADHLRSIVFGIADGVPPSNEGRGYIIKKLIIACSNIAIKYGNEEPVIHAFVPAVIESMGGAYPCLVEKARGISDVIFNFEQNYIKVWKERFPALVGEIRAIGSGKDEPAAARKIGELLFRYRDTFGLAQQALEDALARSGVSSEAIISGSLETFDRLMKKQQEQSRAGSKMTGDVFTGTELDLSVPKTEFTGYDHAESTGTIHKIFIGHKSTPEAKAGDEVKIILNKTPFYAESGGQAGDTGTIICEKRGGVAEIYDTRKRDDVIIHFGRIKEGTLAVDCLVRASIDVDRRLSIMRNHTSTHLLQAALIEVLGAHVQQQGSLVTEDRLRFDFTHPGAVTAPELRRVEAMVNAFIRACDTIEKEYLPIEEARKTGARAFFAEKYGKTVRVVSIGNYSREFCGGTHLGSTGQIGVFKIIGESAIAQGIRRIEARTGIGALEYFNHNEDLLDAVGQIVKSGRDDLPERILQQQKRIKQLEKDLESFRLQSARDEIPRLIAKAGEARGAKIVAHIFEGMDMGLLRRVVDLVRQRLKSYIVVLGGRTTDSASILIAVSDDLIKKGYRAQELIDRVAPLIDGSGGGRAQIAQAGGKSPQKIDAAVTGALNIINEKAAV